MPLPHNPTPTPTPDPTPYPHSHYDCHYYPSLTLSPLLLLLFRLLLVRLLLNILVVFRLAFLLHLLILLLLAPKRPWSRAMQQALSHYIGFKAEEAAQNHMPAASSASTHESNTLVFYMGVALCLVWASCMWLAVCVGACACAERTVLGPVLGVLYLMATKHRSCAVICCWHIASTMLLTGNRQPRDPHAAMEDEGREGEETAGAQEGAARRARNPEHTHPRGAQGWRQARHE